MLFRSHEQADESGHALIVIAFISLFMGFGISWNRRRILDGLAVDDGILSSQAVIR